MWGGTKQRGVSEVLGAILVFALLVSGVAVYQVTVVPQTNEEREVEHSQEIRSSMQDLRNDIQESSTTGRSLSTSIEMGASYPVRSVTLNPPVGSGTFRTVETGDSTVSITVENAVAVDDETADWWTGTDRTFPTGILTYTPSYNYYDEAPVTGYDNTVLYERFGSGTDAQYIAQTDQDVVDGRRISLTALDGERTVSESGAVTLETRPLSPATETVTIEGDGAPLEVTLRTALPESFWVGELLAGQIDDPDGDPAPEEGDDCADVSASGSGENSRYVVGCSYTENPNELNELTLVFQETENGQPVRYELAASKVGVGSDATTPGAKYVTGTEGEGADVPVDGRQKVVFQVRDRYDNPATDVTLDVTLDAGSSDEGELLYRGSSIGESATDLPVDNDGELELVYDAPSSTSTSPVEVDIEATFNGEAYGVGDPDSALVEMEVINASRIDRTEPLVNPAKGVVVTGATFDDANCGGSGNNKDCELTITFENLGSEEAELSSIRYAFYSADSQGSAAASTASELELAQPTEYAGEGPLELQGEYVDLSSNLVFTSSGTDSTQELVFYAFEGPSDTLDIDEGEFFVISAVIDGERRTFFVSPNDASGS